MAVILNIETSNAPCSVALTAEGMVLHHRENMEGQNQARFISDYIKSALDHAAEHEIKIEAIAVSMGPGSYTGLRIGLSEAKGLAYGLGVPMIGISTLELLATRVMFSKDDIADDSIFVPMVDARRMEVYTSAYDFGLTEMMKPGALILEPGVSYRDLTDSGRPTLFFGNGMAKWREALGENATPNMIFIDDIEPLAVDMTALSERAYARRKFLDTAYCTPLYLKDFQATKPRNRVLGK